VTSPPRLLVAIVVTIACAAPAAALAQLAGSNLLLGQVGNWPPSFSDRGSPNRQSYYDQLNLQYAFGEGAGLAGLRFETDRNSDEQLGYEGLTQRYVDWSEDGYQVRVGNFYTILGRGLVHRSFELTGVVLEKTGIRTRLAPSRDVDGVLVDVDRGPLGLRLLTGSPSEGYTSLAEEKELDRERHRGHISGGELAFTVWRQSRIGAVYQRSTGGVGLNGLPGQQEVGSGFVEVDPMKLFGMVAVQLPIYAEYAQQDRTFREWWNLNREDRAPHALYAGTNLIWGPVALSAEWKDYSQFRLGTNDPPSLVREHSAVLLNRATHVLVPQREEGHQLELSYTPLPMASVVLNLTRADGARGDRFEERYAELHLMPNGAERWESTVFYDQGSDSTLSVTNRDTYGVLATVRLLERASVTLDAQRQTAERIGFDFETFTIEPRTFENVYVSLTGAVAELASVSMIWERTTDELDPSWEFGRDKPLHLMSWTISATLAKRHYATLFMGRRRGGLACTAGTCYEVQPFEGAELRVITKF
jgi:hypothetical protein